MSNKFDIKYIYDIFHNDNNKLIIIMPNEITPPNIKFMDAKINKNIDFKLHICSHNHTLIYESLIQTNYTENIQLLINNTLCNMKVNKYPEFKDKIIMSTIVLNEDDYIRQWINFHMNIGVSHFIIYDNSSKEDKSNLKEILNDLIQKNIVLLIKWPYPYRLKKSGFSGQTTQQNHSIYAFRNSKYIGLFDIDEYINMQNNTNIDNFIESVILNNKLNTNNIGSFRIYSKNFSNPNNLPTKGYDFLSIYNCDKVITHGFEKNFVIPKNVSIFSVHMIVKGKPMYNIDPKHLYFNHYRFLNKTNRGRENYDYKDDSIIKHCNFIKKSSLTITDEKNR